MPLEQRSVVAARHLKRRSMEAATTCFSGFGGGEDEGRESVAGSGCGVVTGGGGGRGRGRELAEVTSGGWVVF